MNIISNIQKGFMQLAAIAFVVGFVVAAPQTSSANTGAGATILNVVTVNYQSPGGVALVASAKSKVTVTLVKQAVTLAAVGATTGAVPSGTTQTYTFTATSNANGNDTYVLNSAAGTLVNATAPTIVFELVSNPGVAITNLTLASTVISDVTAADTLVFPAGTATNLVANDIVIIGGTDYKVSTVTGANTPKSAVVGAQAAVITNEQPVTVLLVANTAGSNIAPAFTPSVVGTPSPNIGTLVAEQQKFIAKVTSSTVAPGDGTVPIDITVGGPAPGTPITGPVTTTTTVQGANLTITKEVSTDGGVTFATTGNGAPLSTLIYRITVTNGGAGDATSVIVTDPMPAYTNYTLSSASTVIVAGALPVGGVALPAPGVGAVTDIVDADGYDFGVTTANTATLNVGSVVAGSTVALFYKVTIQ